MNRPAIALASALMLASVPAAAAVWYGQGTYEPDTLPYDAQGYNWIDPDANTSSQKRVYFNVITAEYPLAFNPNSGTEGTHVTPAVVHFQAVLGIWKDCNGDGFIGHREGALESYRPELLAATDNATEAQARCEAGVSPHNDGEWVYEFIHIGNVSTATSAAGTGTNPNVIHVQDVLVWGDLGRPDDKTVGYSCSLFPPPTSTARTGGMIAWGDCSTGTFRNTVNTVDSDDALGIKFNGCPPEYTEKDCFDSPQDSDSDLNQPVPLHPYDGRGDDRGSLENHPDKHAFTVFDCSEPAVDEEIGGTAGLVSEENITVIVGMPEPGVNQDNLQGNYGGALVAAEQGAIHNCDEDADTEVEALVEATRVETTLTNPGAGGKNDAGSIFTFADGGSWQLKGTIENPRNELPTANESNPYPPVANYDTGEFASDVWGSAPMGMGTRFATTAGLTAGWTSTTIITSEEFYVSPEGSIVDKRFFTAYAYIPESNVTSLGLTLPNGPPTSTGTYGGMNCISGHGEGFGEENGWNCDPNDWYPDPESPGNSTDPHGLLPRVGDPFHFRDVDCLNGVGACGIT